MQDRLRTLSDIGVRVREARKAAGLSMVEVAARCGRSRDVLHRLEHGDDVSLSSLVAILSAIGQCIEITPSGPPTLAEMAGRFGTSDDE
jgi:HTH-type transcriptional regulator / antitoxin HipB